MSRLCCCGKDSSLICCGRHLCTVCFYFSPHVRHTLSQKSTSEAVCLQSQTCRRDIAAHVAPVWNSVWSDLARDIARAMDKEAKQVEVDPLGLLLHRESRSTLSLTATTVPQKRPRSPPPLPSGSTASKQNKPSASSIPRTVLLLTPSLMTSS